MCKLIRNSDVRYEILDVYFILTSIRKFFSLFAFFFVSIPLYLFGGSFLSMFDNGDNKPSGCQAYISVLIFFTAM
jgi:hypothetical protein